MSKEAMKLALEALEDISQMQNHSNSVDSSDVNKAIKALEEALAKQEHDLQDTRCECCGYMTHEREHMGCIRSAKQEQGEPVAVDGNTSDGYHTFNDLYDFRKAYNAALFNEWSASGKCSVHKSWRHHDGELCFGGGWFIVVAVLPDGQISNHYEAKDWNLFSVPETERALFEFDGHTSDDVIHRLKAYTTPQQRKPLTDEQIYDMYNEPRSDAEMLAFARAIEAAHGIKE
jgi:hypothetical protein